MIKTKVKGLWANRSASQDTLYTCVILLFMPLSTDLEGKPRRILLKNRRFLNEEPHLSPRTEEASKVARQSRPRYWRTWWYHIMDKWPEASKVWTPHQLRSSIHASFPGLAFRKESSSARIMGSGLEWRLQDVKDGMESKSTNTATRARPHSSQTHHQEKICLSKSC